MDLYDEAAEMARAMIAEFGQPVLLSKQPVSDYDPSDMGNAAPATPPQRVKGILLDYSGYHFQQGGLIQVGDLKLKVPALGLEWPPELNTQVVVGDTTWTVVRVKEVSPGGLPILYELQVRS